MSSRKEEERNEKIIRGLLKLPPNRSCINCHSMGPQYVCTNFWTFICTTCSGIHREFTHRVKSVSMSKFTSLEVDALQKGGNQRAREMLLKDWDPQTQRFPNNSNADNVREFIKNVYMERKYSGSKASNRPPRDMQQNRRNHDDDVRRASSYHSYSQSPPYDFQYEERCYGKHVPVLSRKPGSDRGLYKDKFSSFLSPSHSSDHIYEDGFANEGSNYRVSDYSVSSGGDPFRSAGHSPSSQKNIGVSSPASEASRDIQRNTDGIRLAQVESVPLQSSEYKNHDKQDSMDDMLQISDSPADDLFQLHRKSSAPSVDLFQPSCISSTSTSITLQPSHSSPSALLDLFSDTPLPQLTSSSNEKSSGTVVSQNTGWATFDLPQLVVPHIGSENSIPAISSFTEASLTNFDPMLSLDTSLQWAAFQETTTHDPTSMSNVWHEVVHNIEVSKGSNSQLWKAFEDSPGHLPLSDDRHVPLGDDEHVPPCDDQRSSKLAAMDSSLIADQYEGLTGLQNFPEVVMQKAGSDTPVTGTSGSSCSLSTFSDMAHSRTSVCKSTNPFDLPHDSDFESSTMFLDLASLQAMLPSVQTPTHFVGATSMPWFQDQVAPYTSNVPQGLVVAQASGTQFVNAQNQGPVASVGNPFA